MKALLKEAKRPVILLQSQVNSRIERVHGVIIIKGLLNQDTHIMYHRHNITFFNMGGITVKLKSIIVHVNRLNHVLSSFLLTVSKKWFKIRIKEDFFLFG